jgi:hypothetical protein
MQRYSDTKTDSVRDGTHFVPAKDRIKPKERQRLKIKQIGAALYEAGHVSLDEQARVLGLCRSTTWVILQANHKSSGLSAALINRILGAPELPPSVRTKILEYVEEKAAGLYGHTHSRRRSFTKRLCAMALPGQSTERPFSPVRGPLKRSQRRTQSRRDRKSSGSESPG